MESNFVAFDCSGPLIRSDKSVFQIIPTEVIGGKWGIHKIFVYPNLNTALQQKELFIRIDSGCYRGMALEDQTCDCKGQLIKAQDISVERGSGLIVHIPRQDGRGWGGIGKCTIKKLCTKLV